MRARLLLPLLLAAACRAPRDAGGAADEPRPLGHAGPSRTQKEKDIERTLREWGYDTADFAPVPDRWRLGLPGWERSDPPPEGTDSPYARGSALNPYRQNVLKGDYPVWGQHTFFVFSAISDTIVEARAVPTPSGVSSDRPDSPGFFGDRDQQAFQQNLVLTFELFHGDTAFRPPDWILRATPVFNFNYLQTQENNNVDIDVRDGTTRTDQHVGFQELFFEKHIADLSANYDFLSVTAGIQQFISDFRGFVFFDNNLGVRATANLDNNRWQANFAGFYMLEKDTNSELNTFDSRGQVVAVANIFRQDYPWEGYTAQLSVHYNHDDGEPETDENGFPVRPPVIGAGERHELDIFYFGWAGDGHVGWLNVTHEFFYAVGTDTHNPISDRRLDVEAEMFFIELSKDVDWWRPRVSFLWASGDDDPLDGTGRGFDSILDAPNFAGGLNSFWIRQNLRLLGVGLVGRLSAFPSLRSSKLQGEAEFVNPGLLFWNAGIDADLLQELEASLNVSYLRFAETGSLEPFLNQNDIDNEIGWEVTLSAVYRPLLTNNIRLAGGASVFFPGRGFGDIYESRQTLYSLFFQITLTY